MGEKTQKEYVELTRRRFLRASGTMAALAGGAMAGCGAASVQPEAAVAPEPPIAETPPAAEQTAEKTETPKTIARTRTLGRTGFEVSDISLGCGRISEANVVRYAYDRGVNFFDVAEGYGNGDSERKIGEAMQFMDREKIFIVTKVKVEEGDKKEVIVDRLGKCLERLKTNYVDALYMHSVTKVDLLKHEGFHKAIEQLKADGKVKHAGLSCHGPHGPDDDSLDKVLLAAAEDGRFDVMLLVYNFMKAEEGGRVLKACKEKNIGTSCMKAYAGQIEIEPFDPENPSEEYAGILKRLESRGITGDEAVKRIQERIKSQMEEMEKYKPAIDEFTAKYGVKTEEELDRASIQWVLGNPDMHTVCVSMPDFDKLDQFIPLSGTELSARDRQLLSDYRLAFNSRYCRHGCKECLPLCPYGVPVSTVMRYSYYFRHQKREKYAMEKYAALGEVNGSLCSDCDAPCLKGCPHRVPVQAGMIRVHSMLTLA